MKILAGLLLFAALTLSASDVTGRWAGMIVLNNPNGDGNKDTTALLLLKQTGAEITGTVGPTEDHQLAITKGAIDGDKIAIEVVSEGPLVKLALMVEGDHLKGDLTMSNGQETRTGKVDVARQK
jgi:hypothetical protein